MMIINDMIFDKKIVIKIIFEVLYDIWDGDKKFLFLGMMWFHSFFVWVF